MNKISLRFLIVTLVTITILLAIAIITLSAYFVVRDEHVQQSLKSNQYYSEKLAQSTNLMFEEMQLQLKSFAPLIDPTSTVNDPEVYKMLDTVMQSTDRFNSVTYLNEEGIIIGVAPDVGVNGVKVTSPPVLQALKEKKPLISPPFVSPAGKLLVLVSHPVYDQEGKYRGFIGGTIYLKADNQLQEILGQHPHQDGSYVYVVDSSGNLIYHPDPSRLGDNVIQNKVVLKLTQGLSGAEPVINTKGVHMLAGYTYVPYARWGVISQTPMEVAVEPAKDLVTNVVKIIIPFVIILMAFSWVVANRIITPLNLLARHSEDALLRDSSERMSDIPAWYFEVNKLRAAIMLALDMMRNEANTDALTGLFNRRVINQLMFEWLESKQPFSLILLDIDRFKLLNDTHGHAKGDDCLQYLAHEMNHEVRGDDFSCRYGGEEFMILLPNMDLEKAAGVAERLRLQVEANSEAATGVRFTISLGVVHYPSVSKSKEGLMEEADRLLYLAKENGRNQIQAAKVR